MIKKLFLSFFRIVGQLDNLLFSVILSVLRFIKHFYIGLLTESIGSNLTLYYLWVPPILNQAFYREQ